MRADASAASVPAWPPPMTITSKREGKSTTHLVPVFANREGKPTSIGTYPLAKEPFAQNLIRLWMSGKQQKSKKRNLKSFVFMFILMHAPFCG
jgi:hypothetical protein